MHGKHLQDIEQGTGFILDGKHEGGFVALGLFGFFLADDQETGVIVWPVLDFFWPEHSIDSLLRLALRQWRRWFFSCWPVARRWPYLKTGFARRRADAGSASSCIGPGPGGASKSP